MELNMWKAMTVTDHHTGGKSQDCGGEAMPISSTPLTPSLGWVAAHCLCQEWCVTQNGGSYYLFFKSEREILFLPIIAQLRHEQVVSLLSRDLHQGNNKWGIQSLKIFACSWVYPNIHQGFLVVVQSRWYVNNTRLSKKKNPYLVCSVNTFVTANFKLQYNVT